MKPADRAQTARENGVLLKDLERQLRLSKVLSPAVEAEAMITHFGRMNRLDLFAGVKKVSASGGRAIQKALKSRKKGTPLSHLTGSAPFYGHSFCVTKDTLIPRPETERLVEKAVDLIDRHYKGQNPEILDIGTGSGCIAVSLTLEKPACRMTALDNSLQALTVARTNIRLFGLSGRIQSVHSSLFDFFGQEKKAFWDIIVSNPPYIPTKDMAGLSREVRSEPRQALDGGHQGLETIELLLEKAPYYMKKGGWLLVEIGRGQSKLLSHRLKGNRDLKNVEFVKDLNGIDRVLVAQHG